MRTGMDGGLQRIRVRLLLMMILLHSCVGFGMSMCNLSDYKCAVLLPRDPNAVIGQPFLLQCTLDKQFMITNKKNSSDITFRWKCDDHESCTWHRGKKTVINESTAELYWNEMDLVQGSWHVYCLIKLGDRKKEAMTFEIMSVGYVPSQPTITDVYLFNWQRLVLKWQVEKLNTKFTPNYTSMYQLRRQSEWSDWADCIGAREQDIQSSQQCTVENFDFRGKKVRVRVNASNLLGSSESSTFTTNISAIVVPARVTDLQTSVVDKRQAIVTWKSPKPQHWDNLTTQEIIYKLTYTSPRNGFQKIEEFQSSSMDTLTYNLESLLPYTEYQVTVECRSLHSPQRWSQNAAMKFHTNEDYPLDYPVVLPGNFVLKIQPGNVRDVILYWQNVPIEKMNGIIKEFKITKVTRDSCSENTRIDADQLSGQLSFSVVGLSLGETYSFLIDASNSVGFSEAHTRKAIVILPQDEIPVGMNASFIQLNKSTVKAVWSARYPADTVTFYWCKGRSLHENCQDVIQWQQEAVSTGVTLLTDPQFNVEHMFGCSIEVDRRHSGIVWAPCVYNVEDQPLPPLFEVLHISPESVKFRLRIPDCATSKAFIDGYVVRYCTVTSLQATECPDGSLKQTLSLNPSGEYSLFDLEAGKIYLLLLTSMAMRVESYSRGERIQLMPKVVTRGHVVLIILATLAALFLCSVAVYTICKYQRRFCQKLRAPIPIKVPSARGDNENGGSHVVSERNQQIVMKIVDSHTTVESLKNDDHSSSPLTSGSSDYVLTGHPKEVFDNVDPYEQRGQCLEEDIKIMTIDNMDTIDTRQFADDSDHCCVPPQITHVTGRDARGFSNDVEHSLLLLRASPVGRDTPFSNQSKIPPWSNPSTMIIDPRSFTNKGQALQNQTSFISIPPTKDNTTVRMTLDPNESLNSNPTFDLDSDGISQYTRADLVTRDSEMDEEEASGTDYLGNCQQLLPVEETEDHLSDPDRINYLVTTVTHNHIFDTPVLAEGDTEDIRGAL